MRVELILITLVIIFTVFTTVFAASAPATEVRSLPKWAWVLLCLFVAPLGGIFYLIYGRPDGTRGSKPKRTVAPDDDPEFLRDLERRLREEGETE
jgi:membrane protein implicated in regulation of membrane protease activity